MHVSSAPSQANRDDDSGEESDRSREWLIQSEEEEEDESTHSTGATSEVSNTHDLPLPTRMRVIFNSRVIAQIFRPMNARSIFQSIRTVTRRYLQCSTRQPRTVPPIAHIDLDHTYCNSFSDGRDQRMTPQRRNVCSIHLPFISQDASMYAFCFLLQSTDDYRSDSSADSPRSVRTPDSLPNVKRLRFNRLG